MKTVTARLLPQTDLNIGFAIVQDDGKVRQYYASANFLLSAGPTSESGDPVEFAFQLLKEQLAEQDLDVVLDRGPEVGSVSNFANIKLLPESMFEPEVIESLKKVQSKTVLHQFDELTHPNLPKWFTTAFDKTIARAYAAVTGLYNSLVYKLMDKPDDRMEYLAELDNISKYLLRTDITLGGYVRRVEPVSYLTTIVGEEELDNAIEELSFELSILNDAGLLMGSMVLPSIVELANPVGNGKKVYGVFAYPIINTKLFLKQESEEGIDAYQNGGQDIQELFEDRLDITMLTSEGSVSYYHGQPPYENLILSREPLLAQTRALRTSSNELEALYKQQQEDTARVHKKMEENRAKRTTIQED